MTTTTAPPTGYRYQSSVKYHSSIEIVVFGPFLEKIITFELIAFVLNLKGFSIQAQNVFYWTYFIKPNFTVHFILSIYVYSHLGLWKWTQSDAIFFFKVLCRLMKTSIKSNTPIFGDVAFVSLSVSVNGTIGPIHGEHFLVMWQSLRQMLNVNSFYTSFTLSDCVCDCDITKFGTINFNGIFHNKRLKQIKRHFRSSSVWIGLKLLSGFAKNCTVKFGHSISYIIIHVLMHHRVSYCHTCINVWFVVMVLLMKSMCTQGSTTSEPENKKKKHLSFSEIHAELANLPHLLNLPA